MASPAVRGPQRYGGRSGTLLGGLLTALLLVAMQAGWMVSIAIDVVRVTGFSPPVSMTIDLLPSSWPLNVVAGSPVSAGAALVRLATLVDHAPDGADSPRLIRRMSR